MTAKKRAIKKANNNNKLETSQSLEKIEAILQGAMQEFLTHGFAATTMDKVTSAAGVSKSTVYTYFQDKEKLFIALIERLIANSGFALNQENPEIFEGEPSKVLTSLANNLLNQFSKNVSDRPEFLDLIRLMIAESGRFPMLAQYMVHNVDKSFFQSVVKYLQTLNTTPLESSHSQVQIDDPEAAARVFMGTLVHFSMIEYMLQAGEILPMERQRLVECVVNLILGKPKTDGDKYAGIREKTPRRKRSSSGKFEQDYQEPKQVRSLRLTNTAWENLDAIARKKNLTRSELIELYARDMKLD
ncbi:MAG: TetR/AcrR family transcriptional regulator [Cyanobacteria bacterium P01_A01_bin.45]